MNTCHCNSFVRLSSLFSISAPGPAQSSFDSLYLLASRHMSYTHLNFGVRTENRIRQDNVHITLCASLKYFIFSVCIMMNV